MRLGKGVNELSIFYSELSGEQRLGTFLGGGGDVYYEVASRRLSHS